jgi:hypothetical protein
MNRQAALSVSKAWCDRHTHTQSLPDRTQLASQAEYCTDCGLFLNRLLYYRFRRQIQESG